MESIQMGHSISDEELSRIERRCDAATPGPWVSYVEGREEMSGSSFIMTGGEDFYVAGCKMEDQDFVASARQDIPRLVAEVRRLRNQ